MTEQAVAQQTVVNQLAVALEGCGVQTAAISPGSRCSPLVTALVRETKIDCYSHIDERSAGFFALGAAKASGKPAVVVTTSGTAVANLMPAVLEAFEAGVPMIVLTADRPAELREVGEGQTVDQLKIFGSNIKWFFELATTDRADNDHLSWVAGLAARSYQRAVDGKAGPVHLNITLRKPLVVSEVKPVLDVSGGLRIDPSPRSATAEQVSELAQKVEDNPKGVVVAGSLPMDVDTEAVGAFLEASGYPVLADPLSGLRGLPQAVGHYDLVLGSSELQPSLAIRIGDLPTSKQLRGWLKELDAEQVRISTHDGIEDPDAVLNQLLVAEPVGTLKKLAEVLPGGGNSYSQSWLEADQLAAEKIEKNLGSDLSEPNVARLLAKELDPETVLFTASSMPVRDLEAYIPAREQAPQVLANRGANGIDGTLATAFGVAASGKKVTLLIGDVALIHDIGSLVIAERTELNLDVVLVDNGGGGIFEFLPIAGQTDVADPFITTPNETNFSALADAFKWEYQPLHSLPELGSALSRRAGSQSRLIHVVTDRKEGLQLRRNLQQ